VALAAGSLFTFGSLKSWAGSDDGASQEIQMKDDDSAKTESPATTDMTNEAPPTAGEKDQSGEKDQ